MSYLFISYNITISWLYTPNGFRIIFSLHDSAIHKYSFFGTREIGSNGVSARVFKKNFYSDDVTKNKGFSAI